MNINQNQNFGTHNTSSRSVPPKYIVIHYVGATGDAKQNINYYNQRSTTNASADFYVGFKGDIWQYNPDPLSRYCWSVGGGRKSNYGGSLYGIATNANCISVEMCVRNNTSNRNANSPGWYFEQATINSTIELTKYLMNKYSIPSSKVIRHYDVNGKFCPGVIGWNAATGNEAEWNNFKACIASSSTPVNNTLNQIGGNKYMFTCRQIKIGDTGNDVLLLEEILKSRGYYDGALDKSFGPALDRAVKAYQKDRSKVLSVDGICGPATWADLIAL